MDNEMSSNSPRAPTARILEPGPAAAQSQPNLISDLIPCTATASMFLYAQGSSVICTKYATLHIERVFLRHTENITLLAADTASTAGVGVVVSYDEGYTAILWNYHSGDEIARFASHERLTAVAWMRNGSIIFGADHGSIIIFEPSTSEHISARTAKELPITVIAPASDCQTYAIAYVDGSLVIASLIGGNFTILQNLKASRTSPIITLAWHATSSRQKTDMLAAQAKEGNLKVWSITKSLDPDTSGANIIRVLERPETYSQGQKWMAWSKNGRIIDYSGTVTKSTVAWDVRTKRVTYETIPIPGDVKGLAAYGPLATLFTVSKSNIIQQFDVQHPAQLIATAQHPKHHSVAPEEQIFQQSNIDPPESTAPPTDSGYASMGYARDKALHEDTEEVDRMTVMTDNEHVYLPQDERDILISTFANGLYHDVGVSLQQFNLTASISTTLPSLLKSFALMIKHAAADKEHTQAVSFVRQNRNYISACFRVAIEINEAEERNEHDEDLAPLKTSDLISVEEKMNFWNTESESQFELPGDEILQEDDDEDFDRERKYLDKFSKHYAFLKESEEYRWLVDSIRSASILRLESGITMTNISAKILNEVGGTIPEHLYHKTTTKCTVVFFVELNLRGFLNQYFEDDTQRDIGYVVVLTGGAVNAQAITCSQYIQQVWPLSALDIIRCLEEALTNGTSICKFVDEGHIKCEVEESHLLVTATGPGKTLVDIGEQLAWLCAAFKWSPDSERMAYSTPQIKALPMPEINTLRASPPTPVFFKDKPENICPYFSINSELEVLDDQSLTVESSGCCWHLLFQNPVIIKGFPIPARSHGEQGLEISLELMGHLGDASYLTEFNGVPILKGFSTMFVMTKASVDSMVWHFMCSENGDRISYLTSQSLLKNHLTPSTAKPCRWPAARNFVGWATAVERRAGTSEVDYDAISWSRSDSHSGTSSEPLKVGNCISASTTAGPGMRNRRIQQVSQLSYHAAVNYARQSIFVNLFGVDDRRGWLIDGASAVLHISRTQLTHECSPHSGISELQLADFHHADSEGGANSTVEALTKETNMMFEVSSDPPEIISEETTEEDGTVKQRTRKTIKRFLFHELVRRNLFLLEQLHDQGPIPREPQVTSPMYASRERLQGWDFLEFVSGQNYLNPRSEPLTTSGTSWIQLTKEIKTVNLLGRAFGSLILPSSDEDLLCTGWQEVPKYKDYLTMCLSTANEIAQKYGCPKDDSLRLVDGIYWHKPDLLFEKCDCISEPVKCDRVQVLLPALVTRIKGPLPLSKNQGAVIFGRSDGFTLKHPNLGTAIRNYFDVHPNATDTRTVIQRPKRPNPLRGSSRNRMSTASILSTTEESWIARTSPVTSGSPQQSSTLLQLSPQDRSLLNLKTAQSSGISYRSSRDDCNHRSSGRQVPDLDPGRAQNHSIPKPEAKIPLHPELIVQSSVPTFNSASSSWSANKLKSIALTMGKLRSRETEAGPAAP